MRFAPSFLMIWLTANRSWHFRVLAAREFAKQVRQLAARAPELATYEASDLSLR